MEGVNAALAPLRVISNIFSSLFGTTDGLKDNIEGILTFLVSVVSTVKIYNLLMKGISFSTNKVSELVNTNQGKERSHSSTGKTTEGFSIFHPS